MKKRYPKRVNPETMITRFEEICKSVGLKKPTFSELAVRLDSDQCCENLSHQ